MNRRHLIAIGCAIFILVSLPVSAASTIRLSAPNVLGTLNLEVKQLKKIQSAIQKSLKSDIIDAVVQCGEERMDCEVRTARTWKYKGDTFREVVINVHTVGNTSITMRKHKGKWTKVRIK